MQGRVERLLDFDFCRDYITKSSCPFLGLFMPGTLTYFAHVLKQPCRSWGSCAAGIKSKQLLLSGPGGGVGAGAVPGQDGAAPAEPRCCVQS